MEAADPSPGVTDFATLSRAVSRALRHEPWLFELPMGRQYVHMSEDTRTAVLVGRRKDPRPVILAIDAASASGAGINFYRGSDVVWLADIIPTEFIRILETG